MIYIHKILPLLISPLFVSIFFIFLALILKKRIYLLISLILIIVFSNPLISKSLIKYLESSYKYVDSSMVGYHDYIVVLSGGMIKKSKSKDKNKFEWSDPDRFFNGIDLFKKGKAKKIIFTRGKLPWENSDLTEGDYLKKVAINMGIDQNNILLTEKVENTYDEASEIYKIIPKKSSIILVTSAYHMKRAEFLFNNYNFVVFPFPVDFNSSSDDITFMDFVPSAGALSRSSSVLRELQGRGFYYLKSLIN